MFSIYVYTQSHILYPLCIFNIQALFWYKAKNTHGKEGLVPRTFLEAIADEGILYRNALTPRSYFLLNRQHGFCLMAYLQYM